MVSDANKTNVSRGKLNDGLRFTSTRRTVESVDALTAKMDEIRLQVLRLLASGQVLEARRIVEMSPAELSRLAGLGPNFLNGKKHNYLSAEKKENTTKGKVDIFLLSIRGEVNRSAEPDQIRQWEGTPLEMRLQTYEAKFKTVSDALHASNVMRREQRTIIEDLRTEIRALKSKLKPTVVSLRN
jgi:hypothetical protein